MLELNNVTISYTNQPAVCNFHLTLGQGEICSIVGESGSGKTTVVRAILGLLSGGGQVTEGESRCCLIQRKNGESFAAPIFP